ncbi:MAG: hypothetical protein JOS17DRAFT_118019 [Linnemannia elongata]|nr:MAG: hypothetical protein JOS17DRAFT_118019 [Linnemannia elongata]
MCRPSCCCVCLLAVLLLTFSSFWAAWPSCFCEDRRVFCSCLIVDVFSRRSLMDFLKRNNVLLAPIVGFLSLSFFFYFSFSFSLSLKHTLSQTHTLSVSLSYPPLFTLSDYSIPCSPFPDMHDSTLKLKYKNSAGTAPMEARKCSHFFQTGGRRYLS